MKKRPTLICVLADKTYQRELAAEIASAIYVAKEKEKVNDVCKYPIWATVLQATNAIEKALQFLVNATILAKTPSELDAFNLAKTLYDQDGARLSPDMQKAAERVIDMLPMIALEKAEKAWLAECKFKYPEVGTIALHGITGEGGLVASTDQNIGVVRVTVNGKPKCWDIEDILPEAIDNHEEKRREYREAMNSALCNMERGILALRKLYYESLPKEQMEPNELVPSPFIVGDFVKHAATDVCGTVKYVNTDSRTVVVVTQECTAGTFWNFENVIVVQHATGDQPEPVKEYSKPHSGEYDVSEIRHIGKYATSDVIGSKNITV